jgi:outer membrane scaffolding protein for murein synthesis (MipA/OmpV family)
VFLLAVAASAYQSAGAETLQEQVLEQKGLAPQPAPGEWSVTLGGGIGAGPRFPGANTERGRFTPLIEVLYGKTLFLGINGLGLNVINTGHFRAGPVLGYEGGRRDDVDPHLYGLGDIHSSLTAGVFANYRAGCFDAGATVRQAITHSSNGLVGLAHLDYLIRLPRARTFFAVGPDFEFANAVYNQTWFGVTPTQSFDSGLPVFTPRGGVKDVGIHGTATYFFSQHLLLRGLVSFKDIVGDDANSPIVEDRRQVVFGVGLAYHF